MHTTTMESVATVFDSPVSDLRFRLGGQRPVMLTSYVPIYQR